MADMIANMAGTIFKVLVAAGDEVEAGQDVIVLESMKMEIPLQVEVSGKVAAVNVEEGQFVNEGEVLLVTE
ncbi:MAG: acetyl-CoA carboxylase biotin carboxyl carrier protein subunit [Thermoplasmata archaeon]|nr:acetyl-CoA carboxylase biotin carboxyl carrier protein subunit [Thermoplasmata archaeon]NIS13439.1 acetyl-CoA carboxylase biotin carboxyl carrier protein subunit [Thermoplasmata archaeon]NIS21320.1 acetyl-CoA carboxylase biotin carboxyl carrier protein subunit [Thermoplasmata archaeon]NIT78841.1 acetyl-CoA carboxylase biotin carboxyl carrier protein subunit [Thermoplasmata archaeon]NIU50373.1 acetyl-CoA carboxylase biotin carboxyl carrier protein subunit [Thermoplasmata archaeon]